MRGTAWNGSKISEAARYVRDFHGPPSGNAREFLQQQLYDRMIRILGGTRPPAETPGGACNPSAPPGELCPCNLER